MSAGPMDAIAALELIPKGEDFILRIAARPGASKSAVLGVHNGALRVALAAAPEKGKANKALIQLLSDLLGLKRDCVELTAGDASRDKRLLIRGLSAEELRRRLAGAVS